jgi:hypothetical protein
VPIGTTDDGALHQVLESLPREPRPAHCRDDESHITGSKGRPSRRHSGPTRPLLHPTTVRPNSLYPQPASPLPHAIRPHGSRTGGLG